MNSARYGTIYEKCQNEPIHGKTDKVYKYDLENKGRAIFFEVVIYHRFLNIWVV